MVFDGQPVHDHFKKIDEDVVMRFLDGKNPRDWPLRIFSKIRSIDDAASACRHVFPV